MKKQTGFTIVEILIVIAVLGILGALGWAAYSRFHHSAASEKQITSTATTSQPTPVTHPAETPGDLIAAVKTALAKKYTFVNSNSQTASANAIILRDDTQTPDYKPVGYDYYISYEGGAGLTLQPAKRTANNMIPQDVAIAVQKVADDTLVANGLNSKGDIDNDPYLGMTVYENGTLTCLSWTGYVRCAAIKDIEQKAAATKDIVAALRGGGNDSSFYVGNPEDSSVAGYQRLPAGVGSLETGAAAWLYRKDNGPWTFFMAYQSEIECASYNTPDLKNAFKGLACFDGTTASAVVE